MPEDAPRAVAFDMDGLMFNTEDVYWEVGDRLLRRRGFRYTPELCASIMGRPPRESFRRMIEWHSLPDTVDDLQVESNQTYFELVESRLKPMPGLLDLLEAIRQRGLPMAICTSTSSTLAEPTVRLSGLADYFEFLLTSDHLTHGKPHPEIYLTAAERFGVEPCQMLALEDSENGCRSAVASGAITVAVPGEHSRDHSFDGAALVADSLADDRLHALLGVNVAG